MSTSDETPPTFRRAKAQLLGILGRVRELMAALPEAERSQLELFLAKRPASDGGYTIIPSTIWFKLMRERSEKGKLVDRLLGTLDNVADKVKEFQNEAGKKAQRGGNCSKAKRDTIAERHKLIDQLRKQGFNEKDKGKEIYKHIMEHKPELLWIKRTKRYINHKNMWKKYLESKRKQE